MHDPLMELKPGRQVVLTVIGGTSYRGMITAQANGWVSLLADSGLCLINLAQVTVVNLDAMTAPKPILDASRPKPASKEAPVRAAGKALGRAWLDEDLKLLADGFLDGKQDAELAQHLSRAKTQIKELRQAFECARGNLVDDQISPIAQTWVERWRKALVS